MRQRRVKKSETESVSFIAVTREHVNIKAHPKLNPNLNPKRLGFRVNFKELTPSYLACLILHKYKTTLYLINNTKSFDNYRHTHDPQ